MFLTFDVAAVGAVDAVEVAQPVIDTVIDDLSFQLQEPLRISSMTVLDLTPPVTAGDEREFMQYTGYDQFKLSRSTAMGTTHTVLVPSLRANYAELSRRTQDALDWYIKAMHTPWDADRYIFYWVSFEILRAELGEKVEEPTRLRCTHQIAFCPTCGKPTTQYRQGAATYKFLESFGIPADVAKALWDMRHIVHGAKSFDRERLARLGELLQILRAVTAAALRVAMGIPDDAPPFVSYGAAAFGAPMGVGGIRQVTDNDLA